MSSSATVLAGDPTEAVRVVFDSNIFFQALLSDNGPAGRCLSLVESRKVVLCLSDAILNEVADVVTRPKLRAKFDLRPDRVAAFLARIGDLGVLVPEVPQIFDLERDPKDEGIINLAVAARADCIVSRDRDLLDLTDPATADRADAQVFRQRFPKLVVISPIELLDQVAVDHR